MQKQMTFYHFPTNKGTQMVDIYEPVVVRGATRCIFSLSLVYTSYSANINLMKPDILWCVLTVYGKYHNHKTARQRNVNTWVNLFVWNVRQTPNSNKPDKNSKYRKKNSYAVSLAHIINGHQREYSWRITINFMETKRGIFFKSSNFFSFSSFVITTSEAKSRKCQGTFEVKKSRKSRQVWEKWSQKLHHL